MAEDHNTAPTRAKAKPAEASPFVRQRVTNTTTGPLNANCRDGQQMRAPGDSREALIHENEGVVDPTPGLLFERL